MRAVADLALPSYLASLHSAVSLASEILPSFSGTIDGMANALSTFTSRYGYPTFGAVGDVGSQRAWDGWMCKKLYEDLLT